MIYDYVFLQKAQSEYEASFKWYLERSTEAAEQFKIATEYAIELICNNPYMWRNEYKDFHELCLKKYPFSIVYRVDEKKNIVVVTSVFHHSRSGMRKYRK
jgi:plasmid stabilization system protein ParE